MKVCGRHLAVLFFTLSLSAFGEHTIPAGEDLVPVLARSEEGVPLRCVAFGGSITQAGEGWIGPWLREQFPNSPIVMINAGMSATGSALGVFRLERDVIAFQPDLVLIEFCVNDGGLSDEDAVRYLESIVVRLKGLPNPPAVVMVEAATRGGVNLRRHRSVAGHYGLLEVDLQKAVVEEMRASGQAWETLFSDDVHPNKVGHQLYARIIAGALKPFLNRSAHSETTARAMPPHLSAKPLLLDAYMMNLAQVVSAENWRTEPSLPFWWNRFFLGTLVSTKPGAFLRLPVRGTSLGIMYPMHAEYGCFWVSVDGTDPREIPANSRGGYSYTILGNHLSPTEHNVEIATSSIKAPARLGYLLVAGQSGADRAMRVQGNTGARVAASLNFSTIPASQWQWMGPFRLDDKSASDAREWIHHAFPPEAHEPVQWQSLTGKEGHIDFAKLVESPAIVYASTEWDASHAGGVILAMKADYYAKVWLNGELLATWDGPHGSTDERRLFAATCPAGKNRIVVKLGSGSKGFGFSLEIADTDSFGTN